MSIYLDYNASTPLAPAARAAWLEAHDQAWGNPSSVHAYGQRARHRIDQARARIADLLGCRSHELVLTSGGSEANALAISSACASASGSATVLASAIEHSSVLRNAQCYAASLVLLPVDGDGRLDPATVTSHLTADTRLLCLQFANNETGTLQDVAAIVAAVRAHAKGALILLDCCQGAGKRLIDVTALGVDFASIAAHKFGGPIGTGALFVRNGVRLSPQIVGGRQQQDRRSGSEDAAGACALAAALADRLESWSTEEERQRLLLEECWRHLQARLPKLVWLAHAAPRLANTMSLAHPGVANRDLVTRLDLAGLCVSTGSACMAARGEPSHVVAALGIATDLARSVIRVSIGPGVDRLQLDAFATAYVREVLELSGAQPSL